MSYVQLTSEERYVIYHLKLFKLSLREIARRLGRHHSTISREIQRNGPVISSWAYWHEDAQQRAPRVNVSVTGRAIPWRAPKVADTSLHTLNARAAI